MATMVNFLFFVGILVHSTLASSDWSYIGSSGPAQWYKNYPICKQASQSPINIYQGDVKANVIGEAFVFKNYDVVNGLSMALSNNGHTAKVSLSGTNLPEVSGGGLGGDFVAAQFHFHWNTDPGYGSEHRISSQGWPSELHVVHYRKSYGDLSSAADKADGLAVLGFMLEVSASDNANYKDIVSSLYDVKEKDSKSVPLKPATLNSFLPIQFKDFYRYTGSLTTPPCYESVTWTVFKEPIKISQDQLDVFMDLKRDSLHYILDNVRPVQAVGSRSVEANFDPKIKWSYMFGDVDVDHWQDYYGACGAESQSPINIPASAATVDTSLGNFSFTNFNDATGTTMNLVNDGHTLKVSMAGKTLSVDDGGLGEPYNVAQFHFHWGASSMRGSEHFLDDKRYPMEIHIVTYKSSLGSLGSAVTKPEGLAVLGFFFEVSDNDNPAMEPFISELCGVSVPNAEKSITPVSLDSILPSDRSRFFRYSGSLTTPGCYESVIWTVFDSTITISETQLNKLRNIKSSDKDKKDILYPMVDNYRPVQFLNSRTIKSNFVYVAPPAPHWSYNGINAASIWKNVFPTCGSTKRQSPIDIVPREVTYQRIAPFTFKGFDTAEGLTLKLVNNGHSAVVNYEAGLLQISGGGLIGTYRVAQFHFHWGATNTVGSEHTVAGMSFPLELHIVTYNEVYPSLGVALSQGNGLAVLGFMFEVSDEDNDDLKPILDHFSKIKEPKTDASIPSFALNSMLPGAKDLSRFYRYEGSLTTPGCAETVTWTVFDSTILISTAQLNIFRSLKSSDLDSSGNKMMMIDNFRPVQPLGDRVVISNFYLSAAPPAASSSLFTSMVLFLGNMAWSKS